MVTWFQQHPLDCNGKLLRRFYEPLILLKVLDLTRGAQRPDLMLDRGLDEQSKLWRNFLDQLAFVCDFKTGGNTVTAVAAPRSIEHPVFYLASNSKSRSKSATHLRRVLKSLGQLHTPEKTASQVQSEIFSLCISFSRSRIKTYCTRLIHAIENATEIISAATNVEGISYLFEVLTRLMEETLLTKYIDALILNEFRQLKALIDTPHQLCSHAHSLRKERLMGILGIRHAAHSQRGVWSDIRHYIGRLGFWSKAVRTLILATVAFPHRIENAEVEVIGINGSADLPNKAHLTGLDGVVKRMLAQGQDSVSEQLSQALLEANRVAQIEDEFREEYAEIKPRPHAELLVLEHFHRNGLDFITDDRYIGCSKPSCYCCHIYMQCHPGQFAPRPCHGNLWINWAPPYPLPLIDRSAAKNRARPQEHHTFKMLQDMLPYIRRDLQEQITSRRPKRAKIPDSSTGISSVVPDAEVLLRSARNMGQAYENPHYDDFSDFRESPSVASDSESDGSRKDMFGDDTGSLEHKPRSNQGENKSSDWQNVECETLLESDDEDIIIFRGRTKCT